VALSYGMLFNSVHLVTADRRPLGTGFMLTVDSLVPDNEMYGYLVTAHHVVSRQPSVWAAIPDAATGEMYEPRRVDGWLQPLPGVDIAVATIERPAMFNYCALSVERHLMPVGDMLYPNLGSTIFYVGLFAPAGRMMARSGTIGALEQRGLSARPNAPFLDERYGDYLDHLVDCRSYGGFSGSPCYAQVVYPSVAPVPLPTELDYPLETMPPMGRMHYFAKPCGMFIAHYTDSDELETGNVSSRYGVGVMLRGQEIRAALMSEQLAATRARRDAEILEERAAEG
jgi:hypothetical protein